MMKMTVMSPCLLVEIVGKDHDLSKTRTVSKKYIKVHHNKKDGGMYIAPECILSIKHIYTQQKMPKYNRTEQHK